MSMIWIFLIGIVALIAALGSYTAWRARGYTRQHPPVGSIAMIDGRAVHYLDLPASPGSGPDSGPGSGNEPGHALVFIHGASGNLMDQVAAFRQALEGRHRLIFVDRPGHGHSERGETDMSSPVAQAAVIDALLEELGVERAIVIGHSWGGSVIAAFGVNHATRAAGLIFVAPATHPWEGGITWYYTIAALPVIGWIFTRLLTLPIGERVMADALTDVFSPDPVTEGYRRCAAVELVLRPDEFLANARDVADLHHHVSHLSSRYREIRCPVIVVTGDEDAVVYADIHSQGLYRDVPDARLVVLDGAGHMPHHTRTGEIVDLIERMAGGRLARQEVAAE